MSQYNVFIRNENERAETRNLLLDYVIQPEIAFKIQGNLVYQIDMNTKQVYISPAFMIPKDIGVVIVNLDQFRNIVTHTSNTAFETPIIMVQDICNKDDP